MGSAELGQYGAVVAFFGVAGGAFVAILKWIDQRTAAAAAAALKVSQDGADAALAASEKTRQELTVRIEHLESQVKTLQTGKAAARGHIVTALLAAAKMPGTETVIKTLQDALAALD